MVPGVTGGGSLPSALVQLTAVPRALHSATMPAVRPSTNFLVMQAENMGSEPPNTAGLVFQAGG